MKTGTGSGQLTSGRSKLSVVDHLLDRLNTRDRLLGEGKAESNSAEQLALDIDWTTTHPLHDAGLGERPAGELSQHDAQRWRKVCEETEALDLDLFHPAT